MLAPISGSAATGKNAVLGVMSVVCDQTGARGNLAPRAARKLEIAEIPVSLCDKWRGRSGDSVPRPMGFFALMPSRISTYRWRPVSNPSLVLAPESAFRLLPGIALSSAPASRSVSASSGVRNGRTEK